MDASIDPITRFKSWLAEATENEPNDPNAMSVATVTADGRPSVRILLLKGIEDGAFHFFTNYQSRKAEELETGRAMLPLEDATPASANRWASRENLAGSVRHLLRIAGSRQPDRGARLPAIATARLARRIDPGSASHRGEIRRATGAATGALGRLSGDPVRDRVLVGSAASSARPLPLHPRRRRLGGAAAVSVKCHLRPPA